MVEGLPRKPTCAPPRPPLLPSVHLPFSSIPAISWERAAARRERGAKHAAHGSAPAWVEWKVPDLLTRGDASPRLPRKQMFGAFSQRCTVGMGEAIVRTSSFHNFSQLLAAGAPASPKPSVTEPHRSLPPPPADSATGVLRAAVFSCCPWDGGVLMPICDRDCSRRYTLADSAGRPVLAEETLRESRRAFAVAHSVASQVLPHRMRQLRHLERTSGPLPPACPDGAAAPLQAALEALRWHVGLLERATVLYRNYDRSYAGLSFRPTPRKRDENLAFVPLNLHVHLLRARGGPGGPGDASLHALTTFGAPSAHAYRSSPRHGGGVGLRQLARLAATARAPEEARALAVHAAMRADVVACQSVAALVDAFCAEVAVRTAARDAPWFERVAGVGLLVECESLLSTYGAEATMLGDFDQAVRMMNRVVFRLVRADAKPCVESPPDARFGAIPGACACSCAASRPEPEPSSLAVLLDGPVLVTLRRRTAAHDEPPAPAGAAPREDDGLWDFDVCVAVPVPSETWALASCASAHSAARPELSVRVCAALFTQGINEKQTVSNRLGDSALQEEVNAEHLARLQRYVAAYAAHERSRGRDDAAGAAEGSLAALARVVGTSRSEKRPELLVRAAGVARSVGAVRTTSCKSAKDRTAMSATWEMGRLLAERHGVAEVERAVALARTAGVRRANCLKNVGSDRYAFNALQVKMLPEPYQPPRCTVP
eukprot:m51a1_g8867 putative type i inositol- -bisphosphate 4- (715) ;mRNA; r:584963-587890